MHLTQDSLVLYTILDKILHYMLNMNGIHVIHNSRYDLAFYIQFLGWLVSHFTQDPRYDKFRFLYTILHIISFAFYTPC